MNLRIGMGYDVHALQEDLPLILGGVKIPFPRGLEGYSDADVLLHAIMDALLGAAALGDIGKLFPAGDSRYKGISSLVLLHKVAILLSEADFEVNNLDSVIVAENPKLSPYVEIMRSNIGEALGIEKDLVSVKATTTERLGFTGREEGIAAYAIAMLRKK
ncbi:MAG: 2-C-methyl-D-erythritol 2,4-cyclodiphosphate synthase [Bacillota bacterium]|nr:2-C-methyl-D-erythritol 2,4-cyclodiphosphate synthase [Bacillota bacterium]